MTKGKHDVPQDHYLVRPDQSCMKNTGKFVAYGLVFGVGTSVVIAQNAEPTVSFLEIAGRSIARYIFPATLLGAVFASTTCFMDEARGRQYPVSNGFIGGALAGAALGCRSHQLGKIASYGFLFGLLGGAARLTVTNGMLNINSQDKLDEVNSTLFMNDLRHLAPPHTEK
jgi:hypothetical protein